MPKLRVSPRAFARIALVALVLNCAIVLTGAAVRITGSGLGCPTWPTCNGTMLVGAWEYHTTIEWGNR
ncbi:MAG TPA: COX15/CtaA family protein, partial [Actinomycetota bacterium]|nr:COX15/CtaA family protein [Actinomycetota bacterium]